jgi:hypothetical protein
MAEKPITVATDEAINSRADSRHDRSAIPMRRPNSMRSLPAVLDALY